MTTGISLLPLVLIGLVLLGAMAVIALLLAYPPTRAAGAALLAIGLVLMAGAAGTLLTVYHSYSELAVRQDAPATEAFTAPKVSATPRPGPSIKTEATDPQQSAEASVEKRAEKPAEKPAGETKPSAAEPRPSWVDAPPCRVGDPYQMSVVVGPYATRRECDDKLPEALQGALDAYVESYLGPQSAGRVRLPVEDLREQLVKDQWEETIQASFGPMQQLHVLLQFDHKLRDRIKEQRNNAIIARRLVYTGAGVAGVLLLLTIVFAVLKVDHATGGAYRGRLALAAVAAAAVVAGGWLVVAGFAAP
jgi:uncharacterized membrane protein